MIVFDAPVGLTRQIFVVSADGSQLDQITQTPGKKWDPAWSPDRRRIAYGLELDDGETSIFVIDADGTAPTRVTPGPNDYYWSPAWSPDGTRLAFGSRAGGTIHVINVDGTGLLTLPDSVQGGDPAWSPDGTRLALVTGVGGEVEIMSVRLDGTDPLVLTNTPGLDESDPAWSPDGSQIAYDRYDGVPGFDNVFVMNADGTGQRQLTDFPRGSIPGQPTWSPDGSHIAFRARDGIYVIRPDGRGQRRIVAVSEPFSPDWR